eukprot:CAMPEP_0173339702 /NCGR_PEP_ID=MMETSP1144-20121109/8529_1 /TAXON_ID=483371 /ORGANISM="non described non described, Strain CCMP2298" /LENGTH=41 /DNA_ID= /DNA_START= /DNA_END= /DNA_ORIENTATION=
MAEPPGHQSDLGVTRGAQELPHSVQHEDFDTEDMIKTGEVG